VHQEKTLRALTLCRTAALGGHVDACDSCGNISISYNSCRNRYCPKCQGRKREEWIQAREQDLLPCSYDHLVFTLPETVNALAISHPHIIYRLLFETTWSTLSQFGKTKGLQSGMISILHTWGQNLSLHPHLHCIVPGGGIDENGKWRGKIKADKYMFSVLALSKVFRAKYVALFRIEKLNNSAINQRLIGIESVVYAKRPFVDPKQVREYLGPYTHNVASSNHPITCLSHQEVTTNYKAYKDGSKAKALKL